MARSMQQWAAQQNAAYDTKEQASRTGKSGTVYSSPEIMRKFESIKLRPDSAPSNNSTTKFDFSNMKFNSGFGKVGANTLGDAGEGTMGNDDWMQFAAQSGYLPK
jgi:hypothetical protein